MSAGTAKPVPDGRNVMEPVVQESTPSMIARRVRAAMARGDLPPGMQLGEADLSRQLGVSRGPLREGLQRLTQEGLLVSIRNRGLFVAEMTPERVKDMYLARQAVERAAAERIHATDPVGGSERLMEAVSTMTRAAETGSSAAVGDADIGFHQLLVGLARSPRLTRMHQTLMTETQMCIHALEETYEDGEVRVEEHRAIAASFLGHRPGETDRLLVAHMRDAVLRLTATIP